MNGVVPSGSEAYAVELSGELTIRTITEVRGRVLEALRAHRSVVAQVANDAVADLSFVQLIEAARRSAEAAGQAFALGAPATGTLLETLRRGGFLSEADGARNEFWLMQSGEK